ncbi:phosphotransferase [Microbacterium sp. ZW T5_56]|uniref:phosphotransferase n=1 Tax=Microbacterium sp. ZW T5_56 TaxID=3378081 RepID=UPI0038529B4D
MPLTPTQASLVHTWIGDASLVADMSWNLDTVVLHVRTAAGDRIVKAAGPQAHHHLRREIAAHEGATRPLLEAGKTGQMLHADADAGVILLEYQEGILVEGSPAEYAADTYRQAGELLRLLHGQGSRLDDDLEAQENAKTLAWLERPHRVPSTVADEARRILNAAPARPVRIVPTHGDWQPRNWLIDRGTVRVIDFGRFGWRPPQTDLARMDARQWLIAPGLEAAFLDGYGDDPRDETWNLEKLRQAIATAVWAHQVGDEAFEAQGHRMLTAALTAF